MAHKYKDLPGFNSCNHCKYRRLSGLEEPCEHCLDTVLPESDWEPNGWDLDRILGIVDGGTK